MIRWQPSTWFKIRTKIAPAFPATETASLDCAMPIKLEPPTPSVDFMFPPERVQSLAIAPFESCTATADLISFEGIDISEPSLDLFQTLVEVSEDLFKALTPSRHDGRTYKPRGAEEDQTSFAFEQAQSRDKEGFRKSFTEDRDRSTTIRKLMTIWDRILPLLEPPLNLDRPDLFALPSPLYPFQVTGVKFLAESESALLADDMGTGKTVQTIVAMRILFQKGAITSALIVVPLALLKNWDRELLRWAPEISGVTVVRGSKAQREVQWEKPAHVWLTTYGTVRSDIQTINSFRQFDLVVLDEIQAIKNRAAEQSRAVKGLIRKRSWGLSGTPIENSLDDLVSICDFLNIRLWAREYLTPEVTRELLAPHFLRRRKEDVLAQVLKEKKAFDMWLAMDDAQRAAYEEAENSGRVWLKELGDHVTVFHVLQLLQKLKQICNRDPRSGESCKMELLKELLEVVASEGCKGLVFSQYLGEGVEFILSELSKYKPVSITGSVSVRDRGTAEVRYQADDSCKLLVATPKAGGVGLNLVAGNYVFHFDHWWNPATVRQAEDRVHRIGQNKDVFVYHFWIEDTIEERIYRILERKQKLYADVIDSLSNVESTGLSEEELFGLFDLKAPKHQTPHKSSQVSEDISLERLTMLTPSEFESLIARLYQSLGFGTRVTPASRDGGIDVLAERTAPGRGIETYAIQCKRYDVNRRVGAPEARELLGVLTRDRRFTKGVIVTTSDFTPDCQAFASGQGNLELINGPSLLKLLIAGKVGV